MTTSRWRIHHHTTCRCLTLNDGCSDLEEIDGILRNLEDSCARDPSFTARPVRDLGSVLRVAAAATELQR
jgi:hypothetical protein